MTTTTPTPPTTPPAGRAAHASAWTATRWPGLLLAGVVALAAVHAAQRQGGSPLIYALLFGLALNWAAEHPRALPGLAWAAGPLLRLGVGLLGARLAGQQLMALGADTLGTMAGAMATTLLLGLLGARLMRLPWQVGLLAGAANAVCGASATLALAAVLLHGKNAPTLAADAAALPPEGAAARLGRPGAGGAAPTLAADAAALPSAGAGAVADDAAFLPRQALVVAACATTLSTAAMLGYPWIAQALHLDAVHTGIFLGGSIQDVAQVVAAGYTVGPQTGDTAVALKLARVALLGPLVALVAVAVRWLPAPGHAAAGLEDTRRRHGNTRLVPGFVWLFFVLMALNSVGWMPVAVQHGLGDVSQACVTVAVAALGMRLSLRELASAGWRPFALMALLAGWIAGVMLLGSR